MLYKSLLFYRHVLLYSVKFYTLFYFDSLQFSYIYVINKICHKCSLSVAMFTMIRERVFIWGGGGFMDVCVSEFYCTLNSFSSDYQIIVSWCEYYSLHLKTFNSKTSVDFKPICVVLVQHAMFGTMFGYAWLCTYKHHVIKHQSIQLVNTSLQSYSTLKEDIYLKSRVCTCRLLYLIGDNEFVVI